MTQSSCPKSFSVNAKCFCPDGGPVAVDRETAEANARGVTAADFDVAINADGDGVVITGYKGKATIVVIPESFEGLPLKEIRGGFAENRSIEKVVIPAGVNLLDSGSGFNFRNGTFKNCSSLKEVVLPAGLTRIPNEIFFGCTSLQEVVIPDSVTAIGNGAFYQAGLASVTIPAGVQSIGSGAFFECKNLKSVTIPDSVTEIGRSAFQSSDLTSVTIPAGVQIIGWSAFASTPITEVVINANFTVFGRTGAGIAGPKHLEYDPVENYIPGVFGNCAELTKATINPNMKTLPRSIFQDSKKLSSVTLPATLTAIGYGALSGCTSLTRIDIPASVETIGGWAFYASGLTSIALPSSIKTIGDNAFENCAALKEVTAPAGVTQINFQGTSRNGRSSLSTFKGCPLPLQSQALLKRLGYNEK